MCSLDSVLERFNATSKTLHWSGNLCFSSRKIAFIRQFHPHWRSLHGLWRQCEIDGGRLQLSCRTRASKGEEAAIQWDVFRGRLELSRRERFRTSIFLPILDSLLTELVWRTELASLFTLLISSEAQLRESAWKAHFSFEIEEEVFEDEIIQLVGYIKQRATEAVSPPACLRCILEGGIP